MTSLIGLGTRAAMGEVADRRVKPETPALPTASPRPDFLRDPLSVWGVKP